MQEALTAYLLAHAGLTALVSNRVQWDTRPQASSVPAVTLYHISQVRVRLYTGMSELSESRVQVDCFAATKAEALATARQVLARLNQLTFTSAGVRFRAVRVELGDSEYGPAAGGGNLYRESQDFIFWHQAI